MTIKNGDSLELLKTIPDNSVDCIATDPPYGISFMNRDWDKAVPDVAIWKESLRVMKPGAFAFVLCSPRSDVQAEMIFKLKEAGFEVGFTPIYWVYASGFPKAMNISKTIDRQFRAEALKQLTDFVYAEVFKSLEIPQSFYNRLIKKDGMGIGDVGFDPIIVRYQPYTAPKANNSVSANSYGISGGLHPEHPVDRVSLPETIPATEEAKKLDGSYAGFQPKPAVEVVLVAMKSLSEKTYVEQALKNGKGATWLDDCRIPYNVNREDTHRVIKTPRFTGNHYANGDSYDPRNENGQWEAGGNLNGRFPANLLVQDNALDNGTLHSSGVISPSNKITHPTTKNVYGKYSRLPASEMVSYGDSGDLSRYFSLDAWYEKNVQNLPDYIQRIFPFLYVPKASNGERNHGLNTFNEETVNDGRVKSIDNPFQRGETLRKNIHPTVKPLKLMSYLITLGSREGDTILDPFMGSGTTGVASKILYRNFIGFEIDKKYFEIAEMRIGKKNPVKDIFKFDSEAEQ